MASVVNWIRLEDDIGEHLRPLLINEVKVEFGHSSQISAVNRSIRVLYWPRQAPDWLVAAAEELQSIFPTSEATHAEKIYLLCHCEATTGKRKGFRCSSINIWDDVGKEMVCTLLLLWLTAVNGMLIRGGLFPVELNRIGNVLLSYWNLLSLEIPWALGEKYSTLLFSTLLHLANSFLFLHDFKENFFLHIFNITNFSECRREDNCTPNNINYK